MTMSDNLGLPQHRIERQVQSARIVRRNQNGGRQGKVSGRQVWVRAPLEFSLQIRQLGGGDGESDLPLELECSEVLPLASGHVW